MLDYGEYFNLWLKTDSIIIQPNTDYSVNVLNSEVERYFPSILVSAGVIFTGDSSPTLIHSKLTSFMLKLLKCILYFRIHALPLHGATKFINILLLL